MLKSYPLAMQGVEFRGHGTADKGGHLYAVSAANDGVAMHAVCADL
nr:hypothetical protein [uncultured Campylobacter sp.]